jgi:dTDP-4-amino-4,6-dideoxygalactose transaminase
MANQERSGDYLVFGSPLIDEEDIAEVCATLRSGWIGTGPKVRRFEELFRQYMGAKHAVAVNSGTAALHLSLLVSGVGPGDEVITTAMTFCATANASVHAGARPVFVVVDPDSMNLDPDGITAAIRPGRGPSSPCITSHRDSRSACLTIGFFGPGRGDRTWSPLTNAADRGSASH